MTPIEYAYVFVLSQGLNLGIQKIGRLGLDPHNLILKPAGITQHELSSKHSLGSQNYRSIWLEDTLVFSP